MDNGWVCLSDYSCVSILVVLCVCVFIEQHVTAILLFFVQPVTAIFLYLKKLGVVAKTRSF